MGKRVSISQPAVIQTELRPLDESFWIDANGQLEQWYYQNTGVFSPDRQITPLKLTPHLSAKDADTETAYTPTFSLDRWEVKEYVNGNWVTTEITSLTPSDAYSIDTDGLTLIVAKNNYDAAHAINLTCHARYNDPRDTGVQRWVSESTMLLTSVDATQVFPTINIKNPATRMFNPLKDDPIYEFEGEANWDAIEGQGGAVITEYKADALGTEEIIQNNEDQIINAAPLLNVRYGDTEKTGQQFMFRQTSGGTVSDIGDGVAKIENIKGDTAKIVQELSNGNFASTSGWQTAGFYGGAMSVSNNVATITLGSSGTSCDIQHAISLVATHKYYVRTQANGTGSISSRFSGGSENAPVFSIESITQWTTVSAIATAETGNNKLQVFFTNASTSLQLKNFIVLDLTAMGIDSLTTVEQVEAWLSTHIGNLDYIPYTEGKLVNYGGYSVKWNQMLSSNMTDITTGSLKRYLQNDGSYIIDGTLQSVPLNWWLKGAYNGNTDVLGIPAGHKVYCKGVVLFNGSSSASSQTGATFTGSAIVTLNNVVTGVREGTLTAGQTFTNYRWCPMTIDLTLMFGAGNEPDLDWCNKYLSRDYYPYCPSVDKNIMDVMEVKTGGFNVWDEEWEVGQLSTSYGEPINNTTGHIRSKTFTPIEQFSEASYYFYRGDTTDEYGLEVFFYDEDKNYLDFAAANRKSITIPYYAAYFKICTAAAIYGEVYKHDICVNISDPTRNGTYEPHNIEYNTLPMGIKTVGFNLWDEQTKYGYYDGASGGGWHYSANQICSTNPIKVDPNKSYYRMASNKSVTIIFYDENMTCLEYSYMFGDAVIDMPSKCHYIHLNCEVSYGSTYLHDICINVSDTSRNGTYEPHWESFSDMSWITKIGIENFNLVDESKLESGYISNTTGSVIEASSYVHTDFIPVNGNETYYLKIPSAAGGQLGAYYDSSKTFVSGNTFAAERTFTPPSNAKYFRVSIPVEYNHNICTNKSIAHFNGRYYPHGMTAPYFPNGLCKAGSALDEVKVEGGKIKGIVRVGSVNVGGSTWDYAQADGHSRFGLSGAPTFVKYSGGAVCAKYSTSATHSTTSFLSDKLLVTTGETQEASRLWIWDDNYTDAATFPAAMQGVMLYYELATPYEFEIDYPTKGQFEWYGINGSGQEVPIDALPVYSKAIQPSGYGQGTSRININALYGEDIPVILRIKRYPWSTAVMPPKEYRNISWRIPPIDVQVVSDKGSAVRAQNQSGNFTFSTIVNQQGEIISDEVKQENMVFDWYFARILNSGTAITASVGSGLTKVIAGSTLKNTRPNVGATPSTNVWCEAFVLGAYQLVDGEYQRTKN